MPQRDPSNERLRRLREWRQARPRDDSMAFIKEQFKREVEKPYKQLGALAEIWVRLVPAGLVGHTRLEGLSRGVLHVAVDSSSHLFELDRLLRGGLERALTVEHKGPAFRRVQLRVAPGSPERPPRGRPTDEPAA